MDIKRALIQLGDKQDRNDVQPEHLEAVAAAIEGTVLLGNRTTTGQGLQAAATYRLVAMLQRLGRI